MELRQPPSPVSPSGRPALATAEPGPRMSPSRGIRRRRARARSGIFSLKAHRARRTAWDIRALNLPDPLLTAVPAGVSSTTGSARGLTSGAGAAFGAPVRPAHDPGPATDPGPDGEDAELIDTAEWAPALVQSLNELIAARDDRADPTIDDIIERTRADRVGRADNLADLGCSLVPAEDQWWARPGDRLLPAGDDDADDAGRPPNRAIDLSDGPKLIVRPDSRHPDFGHPDFGHPDFGHPDFGPYDSRHADFGLRDLGPEVSDRFRDNDNTDTDTDTDTDDNDEPSTSTHARTSPPAEPASLIPDLLRPAQDEAAPNEAIEPAAAITPVAVLDQLLSAPAGFSPAGRGEATSGPNDATGPIGRTERLDPLHLELRPDRMSEAWLATVLCLVGLLGAWGTSAPRPVWFALAVLPATGLASLAARRGRAYGRVLRAFTLLAVAAALPLMWPAMTPVTLVITLATVATYPGLTGLRAGRLVTGLGVLALVTPTVLDRLDRPGGLDRLGWFNSPGGRSGHLITFLLEADGQTLTAVRIALGSGALVALLVGHFALSSRRLLIETAALARSRERQARDVVTQARQAAGRDAETGLASRSALREATTRALTRAVGDLALDQSDRRPGMLLIAIDRFADLSADHGGARADEAVAEIARRLAEDCGPDQVVARTGRGEFAVLLPMSQGPACELAAQQISRLVSRPMTVDGRRLTVTCSIGGARAGVHPDEPATADDLLQAATEALHAAAETGCARWLFFDQDVRAHAREQAALEAELRASIEDADRPTETAGPSGPAVQAEFQPILALGTGLEHDNAREDRIVGAQARAYWTRADGQVVESVQLMALARRLGRQQAVGRQLMDLALDALVAWRYEGVGVDQIWLPVGPDQLRDPDFPHQVAAGLAVRGLASSCLVLEVPATDLADLADRAESTSGHPSSGPTSSGHSTSGRRSSGCDHALAALGLFRSLGVAVAVDEFGRHGTSLSALRRLPVSAVKLDSTLSAELGRQDAVPQAVVQLCRVLGLRVVMTGVQTMAQLNGARQVEADAVQGQAVARPMSAQDITNLLTLRLPREFRI